MYISKLGPKSLVWALIIIIIIVIVIIIIIIIIGFSVSSLSW